MQINAIRTALVGAGMLAIVATAALGLKPSASLRAVQAQTAKVQADHHEKKILPDGLTVELLGVTSYPAGPETWWRADGSPLAVPPINKLNGDLSPRAGEQARGFALLIKRADPKADPDRIGLPAQVPPARGPRKAPSTINLIPTCEILPKTRSGGVGGWGGGPDSVLGSMLVSFPKDLLSCTIRLKVPSGPWADEAESGPGGHSSHSGARVKVAFGEARETAGRAGITVSYSAPMDECRFLAIDRKGGEHEAIRSTPIKLDTFEQSDLMFLLPLSNVASFRLQTHPFTWVVFEDVPLQPKR